MRIIIIVISILLFGCSGPSKFQYIPQVSKIRYKVDFKPNLNFSKITQDIVSARNIYSQNSSKYINFSNAINEINSELLRFLFEAFELTTEQKRTIRNEYSKSHSIIASEYFQSYKRKLKEIEYLPPSETTFAYPTYTDIDAFGDILSQKVCTIVSILLSSTNLSLIGAINSLYSDPCEYVIVSAVNPILEGLENSALIKDHLMCRLNIKEHVREMILELATIKDGYKADFATTYERKIFFDLFRSEADLRANVTGIIKAGFDLNKYFDLNINDEYKKFIITLPEPEILSTDIDYKITDMNDGWFIEINEKNINQSFALVKKRLQRDAIRSGILIKAKENVSKVVDIIFKPIAMLPQMQYSIEIKYASTLRNLNRNNSGR